MQSLEILFNSSMSKLSSSSGSTTLELLAFSMVKQQSKERYPCLELEIIQDALLIHSLLTKQARNYPNCVAVLHGVVLAFEVILGRGGGGVY